MTKRPLHQAEVVKRSWLKAPSTYRAVCTLCGWEGRSRPTQLEAEQDAHQHHRASDGP